MIKNVEMGRLRVTGLRNPSLAFDSGRLNPQNIASADPAQSVTPPTFESHRTKKETGKAERNSMVK
jgi:hypothetical protein